MPELLTPIEPAAWTAGGKPLPPVSELLLDAHLVARFWEKTERKGACRIWTGSRDEDGYGFFKLTYKAQNTRVAIAAHRLAYALGRGAWPSASKMVMHTCDQPSCVNPAHLVEGTRSENLTDAWRKNRRERPKGERYGVGGWRNSRCSERILNGPTKLTEADVRDIRRRHTEGELAHEEDYLLLALDLDVSVTCLRDVVKHRTFKWVGGVA